MAETSRVEKPEAINRYRAIIERIFFDRYAEGTAAVAFDRADIEITAAALQIELPKNLGDIVYSIRYRTALSKAVLATQPEGLEWIIEGAGRAKYDEGVHEGGARGPALRTGRQP